MAVIKKFVTLARQPTPIPAPMDDPQLNLLSRRTYAIPPKQSLKTMRKE
jgi:hypothetical protein